ncbi:MAG TPA: toll/interleukin-1 receptor domain-containing protein, partial [Ktedonobacteraceae bacterium]|nr:toll/interleukin-1 receptor domain-containing protein [Ktedonobacteraceae bacterium]
MVSSSSTRTQVFISYSHKDARYLEQLVEQLAYYERNHLIESWSDKKITPGAQWREEIKQAIEYTKVAVLLISPSF